MGGVTAGCASVHPSGAILIGFISAFVYHFMSCAVRKLKIDDPLDAFAVHGSCGLWGCIAVGLFCVKEYSVAPKSEPDAGIFMPGSRGHLLGAQIVFVLLVVLWVVTMSLCMFVPLKLLGLFRVSQEHEDLGADISKHGGAASGLDHHEEPHQLDFEWSRHVKLQRERRPDLQVSTPQVRVARRYRSG